MFIEATSRWNGKSGDSLRTSICSGTTKKNEQDESRQNNQQEKWGGIQKNGHLYSESLYKESIFLRTAFPGYWLQDAKKERSEGGRQKEYYPIYGR